MKTGEVVTFKNVNMTLSKTEEDSAWCQWFVGDELHEGWFALDALKLVPE